MPEPSIASGGHFKSQTSEIRPPAISCTKNVNLMSETTQIFLVHAKQLPRLIWLDSEVFNGSYAPFFLTLWALFSFMNCLCNK